MSMHKTPLTPHEEAGLLAHGLPVGEPSQLADAFRLGMKWLASAAQPAKKSELIERLVEALDCLHFARFPTGAEDAAARQIITEARAALAVPVVTDEEWGIETEKQLLRLIEDYGKPYVSGDAVDAATQALRSRIRSRPAVPEGYVLVPVEPTPGKLMSMAIRHDHGLGAPEYYDQFYGVLSNGVSHQKRLDSIINQMRQLHEEVVGAGFYSVAKESDYADMIAASTKEQL